MNAPEVWTTTITMLLAVFRQALITLVPCMEAVKIGWKDIDAYDDWDEIASMLYRNIVEKTVQHAVEFSESVHLPPYDLLISSYEGYDYIAVKQQHANGANLVFVGFSTKEQPFDHITCVPINGNMVKSLEPLYIPFDQCQFALISLGKHGGLMSVTNINVEI